MIRGFVLALATLGSSAAGAVGLGPLAHDGVTMSDRKGFYLTLINPYPTQERFRLYSVGLDNEAAEARVRIPLSVAALGPKSQRRVLVIDTALAPGETHQFRVCAERIEPQGKALIHARVCSKLSARRVG
jgi:hypothetical protein